MTENSPKSYKKADLRWDNFIPSKYVSTEFLDFLYEQFPLQRSIWHGPDHWIRVLENGRSLTKETGANPEIVELFALIHDCRRENENYDLKHGFRSGDFARKLNGTWFDLNDNDLEELVYACHWHSHGHTTGTPTVMTCWDSDRLDLGRVGKKPLPKYLCTDAAKKRCS